MDTARNLDSGERASTILLTVVASLSTASVSLLLVHIFISLKNQDRTGEPVFARMHLGVFIICLLLSDLCQATSGLIEGYWATIKEANEQPLAVLLLFGDVGTAVWNTVIAIQTFMAIILRMRMTKPWVIGIVVGGWCTAAFLAFLGPVILANPVKGPFYGVTYEWCFVREAYSLERIMVHYLPMLCFGAIILILYLLVFLNLRGLLVVDGWQWHFHWNATALRLKLDHPPTLQNMQLKAISKKVLWYPVVYITLILPASVCRFFSLAHDNTPPIPQAAWTISMCLLYSMGLANSLVYTITRRIGPSPLFSRQSVTLPTTSTTPTSPSVQVYIDRVTYHETAAPLTDKDRRSSYLFGQNRRASTGSSPRSIKTEASPTDKDRHVPHVFGQHRRSSTGSSPSSTIREPRFIRQSLKVPERISEEKSTPSGFRTSGSGSETLGKGVFCSASDITLSGDSTLS